VMAGMMIDRIQKQNMRLPQQTVAEEVMGGGAPPEGAAPPGVAGLPSGMPEEMAGGGIVAFADGGETEDYAGGGVVAFADRGLVSGGITDIIDPGWRSAKTIKRNYNDDDKFAVLAERLAELTSAERAAQGEDKVRIQKDMDELRGEMRKLRPSPSVSGLLSLIPSAQAADIKRAPAPSVTQTQPPATQTAAPTEDAVYSPEGIYMYGEQPTTPAQRKIKPGEVYEPNIIRDILQGKPNAPLPPISTPKPAPEKSPEVVPPATFEPKTQAVPSTKPLPPKREMGPPEPSFADKLLALQAEVPEGRDLESFTKQRTEAEAAAGVDTQLFDKLRQDLATTKGGLKDRADKAAGHALMMFGAGLLGGRRGQEFQNASRAAQQSLMMYMSNMDKITENEEKINSAMRELLVSENQYKRSGLEKDLARMERHQDKIDAINLKNTEIKAKAMESLQRAAIEQAKINNPELYTNVMKLSSQTGKKPEEVLMMMKGNVEPTKSGELNRGALFVLWSKMEPAEKFAYKNNFETFVQEYQGGAGGGGGKSGVKFLGYE